MKIATLTYHRALNYGAVLQAYALQTAIHNRYPDVEIGVLDYKNTKIEDNRQIFRFSKQKSLKQNLYLALSSPLRAKKIKSFDAFLSRNINLISDAQKASIDKFIVGSDQVWNFEFSGNDTTYMLDFVDTKKKKYSYAASIGKWDVDASEQEALKLLTGFSKLSVREKSAADFIGKQIEQTITTVVDPVFLLDKDAWMRIEVSPTKPLDNYIFVYGFGSEEKTMISVAKEYAKKYDAKIIMLKDTLHKYDGVTVVGGIRPEEFVWLIDHARMVITNSFHGTSFSVIFNKEFLSIPNIGKGSRIRELLEKFGLNTRLYCGENSNNIQNEVDWNLVNEKVLTEVCASYEFVDKIISE